jgi:hypothetical protein
MLAVGGNARPTSSIHGLPTNGDQSTMLGGQYEAIVLLPAVYPHLTPERSANLTVEQIAASIERGSHRLLSQFKTSNASTMLGESRLHEATLVNHLASEFILDGHKVWAESPLRNFAAGSTKHIDLLVDFSPPIDPYPRIALAECKCVSPGFEAEKLAEVVEDHGRLYRWPLLMLQGQPVFFLFSPPCAVFGVFAVLVIENLNDPETPGLQSLSEWWNGLQGPFGGVPIDMGELLRDRLSRAASRGTIPGQWADGGIVYTVAYAVYELQLPREENLLQTAQHAAAQAVVGAKSGLHVTRIDLDDSGRLLSAKTTLEWKSLRGSSSDRDLTIRALASTYAGDAVDNLVRSRALREALETNPPDSIEAAQIHDFATACGVASSTADIAKLSAEGFQSALDIVSENCELVEELATELILKRHITDADLGRLIPLLEKIRIKKKIKNNS